MSDPVVDLETLIRTRRAIVTVHTVEERFAGRCVYQAAQNLDMPVMEWTASSGLHRLDPEPMGIIAGTETFRAAMRFLRGNERQVVYVAMGAMRLLTDHAAERALREVAVEFATDRRTLFMVDSVGKIPDGLRAFTAPYDLPLPDDEEIAGIVKQMLFELRRAEQVRVKMPRSKFDAFISNLRGLTRQEIGQVVAEAALADGLFDSGDVDTAEKLKSRRLRETGVLDYVPPPDEPIKVGGMEALRRWLELRAKALTPEARDFGLESPRGILLLGVQGCGKSLMARYTAAGWQLPLLRMDVGALYDKYVGETERHLRKAFEIADAVSPCVLWIDEIEKAFASAGTGPAGAVSDGGLSHRVFGQLLTWMQDHDQPVFLVATANDVTALPPELMRKGRFDEVFFVDLPTPEARREILRIHLSRRKREPELFDLAALTAAADGFSGAEIEQAIVSSMYAAFAADRDVTTKDILDELSQTRPLSVLMAEKVRELRSWAADRCVSAD